MADEAPLRKASFRGVPFYLEDGGESTIGRRNLVREYPYRDTASGEDMGLATGRHQLPAFVLNWDEAQDLVDAVNEPGPGRLIHPWLGSLWGQVDKTARVRYPKAQGGRIAMSIPFVEVDIDPGDDSDIDTSGELAAAVDAARVANDEQFAAEWPEETTGFLDAATNAVDGVCEGIEACMDAADAAAAVVARTINAVASIVALPLKIADTLRSRIQSLFDIVLNPWLRLNGYLTLMRCVSLNRWRPAGLIAVGTTPVWRNPALMGSTRTNKAALPYMPGSLAHWMRRELVIGAVEMIPDIDFTSADEVTATQDAAIKALDDEILVAPDALVPVLTNLRVAVVAQIQSILPTVAELSTVKTAAILPSAVIVYQATGRIDSLDDFPGRNNIKHPGFVPAGDWKVLND